MGRHVLRTREHELRARAGDAEEDDRQPATIITMPTVLRIGPYRCFFFAGDRPEPAHVHVERDANRAKVWLDPVRLQDSGGFPRGELARIILMVRQHEVALLRSWNDYFAD